MKLKPFILAGCFLCAIHLYTNAQPVSNPGITVYTDKPSVVLSPLLYGLFFEDINFGADGGLYAELIQNRSFEYYPVRGEMNHKGYALTPMTAWEIIKRQGCEGEVVVTRTMPLNDVNLNNLEIYVTKEDGYLGVMNTGYDGIPLVKNEKYEFSVYLRMETRGWEMNDDHKFIVQLEDENGQVLASDEFTDISAEWIQFTTTFVPSESVENGRLVLLAHGRGRLQLDMVSLFPEKTYMNRKNGLRNDLVEPLTELNPAFLRFPGGCILHGWGIDNIYNWKETLGDVAERKPNWNRWGYHQTYGLGYFEYFQFCEDMGIAPLPVVSLGVSCSFTEFQCIPMEAMDDVIQDALDLVEFANGPSDSEWGSVRTRMGHPEPFGLEYVCLGNEEGDTPEVRERIPLFVNAFKEKYPEIKIIGTSGLSPDVPLYDLMAELDVWSSDEHYYFRPEWFIENQDRFDNWDRSKPKVFVGEYASLGNRMFNAVAEAIYLTGVERNADIVEMTCYAPLFARYGNTQWNRADLIWFDNQHVVRTPNYYVQQLFATNKGDVYLENSKENWPGRELAVSTTYDSTASELIIKIANAREESYAMNIELDGSARIGKKAGLTTLQGAKDAVNSRENQYVVKPVKEELKVKSEFIMQIPAMSVQVLRINLKN